MFVLGDAKSSGSYTISGLGTITSALFAAGGVQPIGSLRNIELKRHGELVRRLDLYDMLIRGDTTDDARLLPDDVIFIPPIGPTVTVDGEVHRPAIYEIRNETSVADVVQLAGGLTAEADTGKLALTRIDAESASRRAAGRPEQRAQGGPRRCATATACASRACGPRSTRELSCRATFILRAPTPIATACASRTCCGRWTI